MRCSFFPAFSPETFELRFLKRDYARRPSLEETAPPKFRPFLALGNLKPGRCFCAQGIVQENFNERRNSKRGSLLPNLHIIHCVPLPGRVRPHIPFGYNFPAESLYAFKVLSFSGDQRIEVNHPASLAEPEGFR
jgi:hypothetical protein